MKPNAAPHAPSKPENGTDSHIVVPQVKEVVEFITVTDKLDEPWLREKFEKAAERFHNPRRKFRLQQLKHDLHKCV